MRALVDDSVLAEPLILGQFWESPPLQGRDNSLTKHVYISSSLLDESDAKVQTAPHILLASKDEPADKVALYKEIMGDQVEATIYPTMHHGWMGARSDLKDEENVKEFERGYKQAADFFAKHL